jgi:hypothetical protein
LGSRVDSGVRRDFINRNIRVADSGRMRAGNRLLRHWIQTARALASSPGPPRTTGTGPAAGGKFDHGGVLFYLAQLIAKLF